MILTKHAQELYQAIERLGGGAIREQRLRAESGGFSHGTFIAARQELCQAGLIAIERIARKPHYRLADPARRGQPESSRSRLPSTRRTRTRRGLPDRRRAASGSRCTCLPRAMYRKIRTTPRTARHRIRSSCRSPSSARACRTSRVTSRTSRTGWRRSRRSSAISTSTRAACRGPTSSTCPRCAVRTITRSGRCRTGSWCSER